MNSIKMRVCRILGAIGILAGFASCKTISMPIYTVQTSELTEKSIITIVLIADLHSTIYGEEQRTLIEMITAQKPDLILLAGDIVDDKRPMTGTTLLLDGIRNLAPIYYVTGNHEYMSRRSFNIDDIRQTLESFGVVILSDTYTQIDIRGNAVIIAGVEDPKKKKYETPSYDQSLAMEKAFRELDKIGGYKILVAHRPERIKIYAEYPFDLVVSGHAHGGQIRIPHVFNGLYAPDQGLFPRYAGGIYTHGTMTHIVSRGLSVGRPLFPRIGNSPELVVIFVESNLHQLPDS
jgi:predicted MPP superfamily phosphohydrolase